MDIDRAAREPVAAATCGDNIVVTAASMHDSTNSGKITLPGATHSDRQKTPHALITSKAASETIREFLVTLRIVSGSLDQWRNSTSSLKAHAMIVIANPAAMCSNGVRSACTKTRPAPTNGRA